MSAGITAHIMCDLVDNGEILNCRRFKIYEADNIDSLLARFHHYFINLFVELTKSLQKDGDLFIEGQSNLFQNEKWRDLARKDGELDEVQTIHAHIFSDEMERIIRETHISSFQTALHLHGRCFVLDE